MWFQDKGLEKGKKITKYSYECARTLIVKQLIIFLEQISL